MSGLRFCFFTTFYPPYNFGGDGINTQRLARALVRVGHRVTVVHDVDAFTTLSAAPAGAPEPEPAGVEVVPLRSGFGAASVFLTQQLGRPVLNGRRIARILREGEFDVINFHNTSLIGGPGLLRYGRGLKLYIAHEHWLVCPTHVLWRFRREPCTGRRCLRCQLSYRRPPQYWRWTGFLERELRHVDAFIALSEFSKAKHREFGFTREMAVLPSFLPEQADEPVAYDAGSPWHRPYFLFVGRLERLKGLQDVIPVFRDDQSADLLVVGDGQYGPELRAQAAGIQRVHFLGRVPPGDLSRYYRHALALIAPSIGFETFGNVLLEAFRQSTPVLARRLGSFPELVDQSGGGELFASPQELRLAMRRIQQDAVYRENLGNSGYRAFCEHWSERVVIPRYLEIVREAAQRRGHRRIVDALARPAARAYEGRP